MSRLPGGFAVGRGLTVYGAFSAGSREAQAYLDHEREVRDAQGNNAALAEADLKNRQRVASAFPVAGQLGSFINEYVWKNLTAEPGAEATAEDVQNILRSSQQTAEKSNVIRRATDFRRGIANANYLGQDVNDQEQSRREREVAREEQRRRIRDNQTTQVEELNKERERKMSGDLAGEAARLTASGKFTVTEADVRNTIQREYNEATGKVTAQTNAQLALNDERFAGGAAREARERGERVRDVTLQAAGLGNRLRGDTDASRRVELERDIEGEQNVANQRSPLEGAQYAADIAPRRRLELEKQINAERVQEAAQTQDRIADAQGRGEEAMLNATQHHYEAAAAVLKRSVDDQVKSLRERADAEQDVTRKAQLTAEATAAEASGQVQQQALAIQQQREMRDRATEINAQSDVTALRTQHRGFEAARRAINNRINNQLRHLDASDTEGRAALERERGVDLAALEEDRRRSINDIRNQTGAMALQNTNRPYSAQLKEIQDRYDKQIEDATGDPVKQGALGRQREEAIDALHQHLKRRTSFRSTMTDIYFGLQGSVLAESGDFQKRMADRDATFKATDKLDKAAQKLLDSKPVTIIR